MYAYQNRSILWDHTKTHTHKYSSFADWKLKSLMSLMVVPLIRKQGTPIGSHLFNKMKPREAKSV